MNSSWQWWNRSHPQTLKIGVGLSYMEGVLGLLLFSASPAALGIIAVLEKLGIDGVGWLVALAVSAGWLLIAVGMANDKRVAWQVAVALALIGATTLVLGLLIGVISFAEFAFAAVWNGALLGGLLHPMTREYQKIWMR